MRYKAQLGIFTMAWWLITGTALACSLALGFGLRDHPFGAAYPTNGIFFDDTSERWEIDGTPISLEPDAALTALLGRPVSRASSPLPAGARVTRRCGSIAGICAEATLGEGPDLTPPVRPELELQVTLVDGGHDGSGFRCPEPDTLSLTASAAGGGSLDDTRNDGSLILLVFAGSNSTEVETAEMPSAASGSAESDRLTANVLLGLSGQRNGTDAFQVRTLCVAVEAMDASGNRSERSPAVCVDTLDRDAPTTVVVQGHGGGCNASNASGSNSMALVVIAASFAMRRRRTSGA